MSLNLSGISEKIDPYVFIGDGRVVDLMPRLIREL